MVAWLHLCPNLYVFMLSKNCVLCACATAMHAGVCHPCLSKAYISSEWPPVRWRGVGGCVAGVVVCFWGGYACCVSKPAGHHVPVSLKFVEDECVE